MAISVSGFCRTVRLCIAMSNALARYRRSAVVLICIACSSWVGLVELAANTLPKMQPALDGMIAGGVALSMPVAGVASAIGASAGAKSNSPQSINSGLMSCSLIIPGLMNLGSMSRELFSVGLMSPRSSLPGSSFPGSSSIALSGLEPTQVVSSHSNWSDGGWSGTEPSLAGVSSRPIITLAHLYPRPNRKREIGSNSSLAIAAGSQQLNTRPRPKPKPAHLSATTANNALPTQRAQQDDRRASVESSGAASVAIKSANSDPNQAAVTSNLRELPSQVPLKSQIAVNGQSKRTAACAKSTNTPDAANNANTRQTRLAHIYATPSVGSFEPTTEGLDVLAPPTVVAIPRLSVMLFSLGFGQYNPLRKVSVGGFRIQQFETTVREYAACVVAGMCATPATGEYCNWGRAGFAAHPINCVSALQAQAYAAFLSTQHQRRYRLPTCTQWERAARDANAARFAWGDAWPGERCNGCNAACPKSWRESGVADGWSTTAPIDALPNCTTSLGVRQMNGNVAEWCRGGIRGHAFDLRGGSWRQLKVFLDPAMPSGYDGTEADAHAGFRLLVE